VHYRFANGLIHKTGKPWTSLHDLRQFIRLSGLKKKVPNVSCDLLYVRLTRRYTIENSKKVYRKIDFDMFYEELLSSLARLVYPRLTT
jgi:hypothetical protein